MPVWVLPTTRTCNLRDCRQRSQPVVPKTTACCIKSQHLGKPHHRPRSVVQDRTSVVPDRTSVVPDRTSIVSDRTSVVPGRTSVASSHVGGAQAPSSTIRNQQKSTEIHRNPQKSTEIHRNPQKSAEIAACSRCHPEPHSAALKTQKTREKCWWCLISS